jgi:phosphopentomutase
LRALIGVLDSFGIGAAPDAARFGDAGANTFGHIALACAEGRGDNARRRGPLQVPNLLSLGLGLAAAQTDARALAMPHGTLRGRYGAAAERSRGKDTPSGHWEMMGLPVDYDWGYFPATVPTFPRELTDAFIRETGVPGILGDCHASGTAIIEQHGEEHIRTGKPICYTSADSVFQIAAHETHFGLERLYAVSQIARRLADPYNVGRVIARPFVGERRGEFQRTYNRHDYAMPPREDTLLDVAKRDGRAVIGIGKIADIFAGSGITQSIKTAGNDDTFARLIECAGTAPDGSITFANFVDFDQNCGHRRDVPGYAGALEDFDAKIPALMVALKPGDLVVFCADHGCDPTMPGSDHTREYIPVIAFGPGIAPGPLGMRDSFADIGQSIAGHLGLPRLAHGTSFL